MRDAVVLELWREEMNAFQMPGELIEPALGGPDTTERVHTAMAVRLLRLTDPDDTCDSIIDDLRDNFGAKGKLTVTLDAPVVVGGDCPVTDDGGYTGFEHNLYRIEVAQTNAAAPLFKWSQFGGGLVGRGKFDAVGAHAHHRRQRSGHRQLRPPGVLPRSLASSTPRRPQPIGAAATGGSSTARLVTLNSATGVFSLPDPLVANSGHLFGAAIPGPVTASYFFRLWNGVEPVADFDGPAPLHLQDGILLQFDAGGRRQLHRPATTGRSTCAPATSTTRRRSSDNQPPEGIHYHRVPLGILHWQAPGRRRRRRGLPPPLPPAHEALHLLHLPRRRRHAQPRRLH